MGSGRDHKWDEPEENICHLLKERIFNRLEDGYIQGDYPNDTRYRLLEQGREGKGGCRK